MKELPIKFSGTGEVTGWEYEQLLKGDNFYVYQRTKDGVTYYEVFKRVENIRFNCVSYPKQKSFGKWAWCCYSLKSVYERIDKIKSESKEMAN